MSHVLETYWTVNSSAQRVAKGAAYLDRNYPGWERKVDVAILDITETDRCICGQVISPEYGWAEVRMDVIQWGETAADYGFALPSDGDTWVSLIKERFNTGNLSDLVAS